MERRSHNGVGFALQTEQMTFGPAPDAFGPGGADGSSHGAWPSDQVGFSNSMNLLRGGEVPISRGGRLLSWPCTDRSPRRRPERPARPGGATPGPGGAAP